MGVSISSSKRWPKGATWRCIVIDAMCLGFDFAGFCGALAIGATTGDGGLAGSFTGRFSAPKVGDGGLPRMFTVRFCAQA